ncbi:MAG: isoleucyl-tRNA synthetase, partial [Bradymonadia bacterium]
MADTTRDWKDTILLPQTDFPMRANLAEREADLVARWEAEGLYHKMLEARADAPPYIFHDGPPYANGNIHHGHALNKILKDFVVKFRHLSGFRATNIPGWDCHGLPIEHKVDQELGKKKREMSVVDFRKECRVYADKWVAIQRDEFKRLMVLAEWERPYKTMNFNYEATTLRQIGRFMEEGYVYNGLKPVHWSWAAVTALADAEVEYAAYTAPSVYVRFAFPEPPAWLAEKTGGRSVDAVIWTTTPWTLPSNLAIALGPELDYELLALNDSEAIILANGLKESVFEMCNLDNLEVLHSFKGSDLVGNYGEETPLHETRHPFIDRPSVLVPADYVTLEQGTGLVHTAPGHGADDFETGKKFDLGVVMPINQYGKFNAEIEAMGEFAAGLLNKHV